MAQPQDPLRTPSAPIHFPDPATVALTPSQNPVTEGTVDSNNQSRVTESHREDALDPNAEIGRPFGNYELLGEIERGGMGVVYRAREKFTGRLVALKMMLGDRGAGHADLRRFVLEAHAMGQVNHPGIVAIHAWGEHQGHPFYTMDLVPGKPLSRILEKGPLPADKAVGYLLGIARAVGAAHEMDIVHRDLKPNNVIIDTKDHPRVLDFGLAKWLKNSLQSQMDPLEDVAEVLPVEPSLEKTTPLLPPPGSPLTEKGALLGTPSYMAPEQIRQDLGPIGPASDVHALGAIFFEMLTGKPPFEGKNSYDILQKVMEAEAPPLPIERIRAPRMLAEVCTRCLAKDPEDRYPHAGALALDLENRWLKASLARRFRALALLALVLVIGLQGLPLLGMLQQGEEPISALQLAVSSATASIPIREAGVLLTNLLYGFTYFLAPYGLAVCGLAWLVRWVENAERPVSVALCWTIGTALVLIGWLIAGLPLWQNGVIVLPWFLVLATCASLSAAWKRSLVQQRPQGRAITLKATDSYLGKLLGARQDSKEKVSLSQETLVPGLTNFERGKVLYDWDEGQLIRGRQPDLDRPVLLWLQRKADRDNSRLPGVVVHHPAVLNLYVAGQSDGERFLATEAATGTPLALWLLQRGNLLPEEAVALTARIARAVQAFHDQGAFHGRLRPEWILVHGDLEPLLCPCGLPSQTPGDSLRDIVDLGNLLKEWLPPQPKGWQRSTLSGVYRVCQAAREEVYLRADDLADDLDRAVLAGRLIGRERWAQAAAVVMLLVPLLALVLKGLGKQAPLLHALGDLATYQTSTGQVLLLNAGILLLGYTQGQVLSQRWRLRTGNDTRDRLHGGPLAANLSGLIILVVVGVILTVFAWSDREGPGDPMRSLLLVLGELAGFWCLGLIASGILTFIEFFLTSLRQMSSVPSC